MQFERRFSTKSQGAAAAAVAASATADVGIAASADGDGAATCFGCQKNNNNKSRGSRKNKILSCVSKGYLPKGNDMHFKEFPYYLCLL